MSEAVFVKEQALASDPSASIWVGAHAGSGKTRVLVDRMLRLLLAGVPPGSILCLTFTRAAAGEMRNRLFDTLGPWVCMEEEKLEAALRQLLGNVPDGEQMRAARLLFGKVLDTPGELRIQTIHAFCEHLLGRFPIEAGVPAQFRVLDEHESSELRLSVRDGILRGMSAGKGERELADAVDVICADITEQDFRDLLAAIDKERQRIRELLPDATAVDNCIRQIDAALGVQAGETPSDIEAEIADPGDAQDALLEAAALLIQSGKKTFVAFGENIENFLSRAPGIGLKEYMDVFFTTSGKKPPRKKLASDDLKKKRPDMDAVLRVEQERLDELRRRHDNLVTAQRSRAVARLSWRLVEDFAGEKRNRGMLDYDDLIEYAARLLRDSRQAAWVSYKLDEGIAHILVDEAQDTSPRQWEVIAALAEEFFSGQGSEVGEKTGVPRSLFAVGDEKQSIFRFQGADLEAYDKQRKDFGARVLDARMAWREVPLRVSFRSTPEVLEAVDCLFAKNGDASGESNRLWRSVTKSGEDNRHQAHRKQEHGLVELWDCEGPDADGGKAAAPDYWSIADAAAVAGGAEESGGARLAKRIAAKIRGWWDEGSVRPQDILILVQRRNVFVEEMIRALKQKGVPVAGADRMRLTEHLAVMDLLALARFCLLADDDLSLAELLKSPLVGLDDDDLFAIAHGREGSLWRALRQRGKENEKFGEIVAHLRRLRGQARELAPFAFFQSVLIKGGREKLVRRLGLDASDPLDAFLDQLRAYERDHAPSLQEFLRWLERPPIEIKRDQDSAHNEVRVMTVHGAKGLEADVVFLPDTCRSIGHAQHDPKLFFGDAGKGEPPLLWVRSSSWDVAFSEAERERFRAAEQEENWRLLYVAMTRARDRLYICGHSGGRGVPEDCWLARCQDALKPHMKKGKDAEGNAVWRLGEEPSAGAGTREKEEKAATSAPVSPVLRDPPKPEKAVMPLAPSRAFAAAAFVGASGRWHGEERRRAARRRGTILHAALCRLGGLSDKQRRERVDGLLAALAPEAAAEERGEMAATLERVFASEECKPIFRWRGRNEVALGGMLLVAGEEGEEMRRIPARVDRLCFPAEGEVVAVEYKSDRRPPRSVESVKDAYLAQVGIYRRLLLSLWPEREIRCGILWIETARFMEIPAEKMPRLP